jgi:hypothetical protein
MNRREAYEKTRAALSGYDLRGDIVTEVTNVVEAGGSKTVFTDDRLRIEVRDGKIQVTPANPRHPA